MAVKTLCECGEEVDITPQNFRYKEGSLDRYIICKGCGKIIITYQNIMMCIYAQKRARKISWIRKKRKLQEFLYKMWRK